MRDYDVNCPLLHSCLASQNASGFRDILIRRGSEIGQPQSHPVSQVMAAAAFTSGHAEMFFWYLSDAYRSLVFSPGILHGALWYAFGTGKVGWEDLPMICPLEISKNKATTSNSTGTDSFKEVFVFGHEKHDFKKHDFKDITLDHVKECLHGIGHSGFVSALKAEFHPCSRIGFVNASIVINAFTICRQAPSKSMESLCADGYYHAVFEHYDFFGTQNTWMWPCDSTLLPYSEKCFLWLFQMIGQTYRTDSPLLVDAQSDAVRVWNQRRMALERHPGNVTTVCSMGSESITAACIYGLSAMLRCQGPWCSYYRDLYAAQHDMSLSKRCQALMPQSVNLTMHLERYWTACVIGSAAWHAKENDCESLMLVEWQPYEFRKRASTLCQRTFLQSYGYARAGSQEFGLTWEWWFRSDQVF